MSGVPVLLEVADTIATIALNRPATGNTIDMAMARALLDAAIRCDAGARTLLHEGADGTLEEQFDREDRAIATAGGGPDGKEGIAALLARRKPDFTGAPKNG